MESVFLEFISDRQLQRLLTMTTLFRKYQHIISFDDIRETNKITINTAKSDLKQFEKHLPTSAKLVIDRNEIKLVMDSNNSLDTTIFSILNMSIEYQIIYHIFVNDLQNIFEFEEKLNYSESSLRQKIKNLNKMLTKFEISISSYRVSLIGEEIKIRNFYYLFFKNINCHTLFNNLFYSKIDINVQKSLNELVRFQSQKFHINSVQYTLWIYIAYWRFKNNFNVKLDIQFIIMITQWSEYLNFHKKMTSMNSNFPPILNESEAVFCFLITLDTIIYSKSDASRLILCKSLNYFRYETNVQMLLNRMINELEIIDEQKNSFRQVIMSFFINSYYLNRLSCVLIKSSDTICRLASTRFNSIFNVWLKSIKQSNIEYIDEKYAYEITSKLTLISSQYYNQGSFKQIIVACTFFGECGLITYLQSTLRSILPQHVKLHFFIDRQLTTKQIKDLNCDLILTNYYLSFKDYDDITFYISFNPTDYDWLRLLKKINDFQLNN